MHDEATVSGRKRNSKFEQEVAKLNADLPAGSEITATPKFVAGLAELVYRQAISVGEDLEMFARHAKRKTINVDDLYMVTRRNDILTEVLKEFAIHIEDEAKAKKQEKLNNEKKEENSTENTESKREISITKPKVQSVGQHNFSESSTHTSDNNERILNSTFEDSDEAFSEDDSEIMRLATRAVNG
ncbi:unnamed protein product [[Candida] boidinii]|uniref:Unnamed protein product n=1 Tax=Candida boidinii TaxID=5477 RepID=A0A9W6T5M0_CANBO|nr:unnamed protein product [[Candida] boidinii]